MKPLRPGEVSYELGSTAVLGEGASPEPLRPRPKPLEP